jgi:hypothetical protein
MSSVVRACAALLLLCATAAAASIPALPADLPPAHRERLQAVADDAAVAARVDADPFVGRRDVFEFLLDHPEFAAKVTRVLKVARYRIWREADGLHLDDGWGAVGRFDVVHAAAGRRVMYARGVYQKRLLPDIHGEAVVMIEYGVVPGPAGRSMITAAVTGFVKLDNGVLGAAMKLATPIARAKAEREGRSLVRVFSKVIRAADERPAALCDQLAREPDVSSSDLAAFRRLLNTGGSRRAPQSPHAEQPG